MFTAKQVPGQTYSNRVRKNLCKVMEARGITSRQALPNMSQSGLHKFVSGRGDITLTKLQIIADDLGVSIFDLLRNPNEGSALP